MRFIRNERALLNSICLLHVFVLFFVSATPSFNVSISPIHSSINYWPPESWTSTTLGCRGSVASISFFHSIQRLLEQGTAHYISPSRLSEQGGEQRRASASTTRSNSAARPSDQVSDRNDDWRKSTQLFCKCQQRIGDDCCCSEAEMSDAFGVTGHDPMVLQFRFTGSAVYLFGLTASSPSSLTSSDSPSSAPCISFAIDDEQLLILSTIGIASSEVESCSMKEPIFSHSGLSHDREHKLSVVISPSSVFLLSHLVYTTRRAITETHQPEYPQPQSTPTTTTTLMPNLSPPGQDARVQPASGILQHQVTLRPRTEAKTEPTSPPTKKHNVATFAAAVGTVVGVLAIVSLAVAFSIIRRRRLARLRDADRTNAADDEGQIPRIRARRISSSSTSSSVSTSSMSALHTDASEDTPNPVQRQMMQIEGPRPFVPRFFPGTTVLPQQARSVPLIPPLPLSVVADAEDQGQGPEQDPPPYDDSVAGSSSPVGTIVAPVSPSLDQSMRTRRNGSASGDLLGALRARIRGARNSVGEDSTQINGGSAAVGVNLVEEDYYPSYADVPPPTPPPLDTPVSSRPTSFQSPPVPRPPHLLPPTLASQLAMSYSLDPRPDSPSSGREVSHTRTTEGRSTRETSPQPAPHAHIQSSLPQPPSPSSLSSTTPKPTPANISEEPVISSSRPNDNDEQNIRISQAPVRDLAPGELQSPPGLSTT